MQVREPLVLSSILSERIGLPLNASLATDAHGEYLSFVPVDMDAEDGFSVRVRTGLSHVSAEFIPGTFSRPLLNAMESANSEQRVLFRSFAQAAVNRGYDVKLVINEAVTDAVSIDSWPVSWKGFSLIVRMSSVDMQSGVGRITDEVLYAGEALMGMVLSLLPTEEPSYQSSNDVTGYAEGDVSTVMVNKYERNPLNRAACLQMKGTSCSVCGFNFGETYGAIGEGFIHVHHVTPVSSLGPGYIIDPATDLVPVCPNCHYMLHRRTPPLSVDELKDCFRAV